MSGCKPIAPFIELDGFDFKYKKTPILICTYSSRGTIKEEINMSDDLEINYEEDEGAVSIPDEDIQWSHEVLNQFELLIDSLGIETVFFLLSREHEDIISNWVKNKLDIQHRRKQ